MTYRFTTTHLCTFIFTGLLIYFGSLFLFDGLEGFSGNSNPEPRCPNILIQKGAAFYLYNSKLAKVPGVNPVKFSNLEEYTEFLEWQRSQNIRCPVLYVQNTYDAEGHEVFQVRPSVFEPQGGLPQSVMVPPIGPEPRKLLNPQYNNIQFENELIDPTIIA
jgi:hypothetical protein